MRSIRTRSPSVFAVRLACAANVGIDCLDPAAASAAGEPAYSMGYNGSGQLGFDEALLPRLTAIGNVVLAVAGSMFLATAGGPSRPDRRKVAFIRQVAKGYDTHRFC